MLLGWSLRSCRWVDLLLGWRLHIIASCLRRPLVPISEVVDRVLQQAQRGRAHDAIVAHVTWCSSITGLLGSLCVDCCCLLGSLYVDCWCLLDIDWGWLLTIGSALRGLLNVDRGWLLGIDRDWWREHFHMASLVNRILCAKTRTP